MSYEVFGKFYDLIMQDRSDMANTVRSLLKPYLKKGASVLELGCGTGAILEYLKDDYAVSGLDISNTMLSIASAKLPGTQLFQMSMTSFDLNTKYDGVICIFDTINHLLRFSEWKQVFKRASAHLNAKGIFIFDINTEYELDLVSKNYPHVDYVDDHIQIFDHISLGRGKVNFNLKVLEPLGASKYRLHEEDIVEISFPVTKIRDALLKYFKHIKIVDPKCSRWTKRSKRLYFVCEK